MATAKTAGSSPRNTKAAHHVQDRTGSARERAAKNVQASLARALEKKVFMPEGDWSAERAESYSSDRIN
jgi:hypothetical protein